MQTATATPLELFQAGQLEEAIRSATDIVRAAPGDMSARSLLSELLCFNGELERADRQLDALDQVSPDVAIGVSQFRHLIRAEMARRDLFVSGRVPEFVSEPSEEMKFRLGAVISLGVDDLAAASQALQSAEEQRVVRSGTLNGNEFDDFRDLDDLLGSIFEVLTSNGKYYWVPIEEVKSVTLQPIEHLRDMLWRAATIDVADDLDGEVFLPAQYVDSWKSEDERVRIGRTTDWSTLGSGVVQGEGQKMYLAGDEAVPVLEVTEIHFND